MLRMLRRQVLLERVLASDDLHADLAAEETLVEPRVFQFLFDLVQAKLAEVLGLVL